MDRDGFSNETKINQTKTRIKNELGDRNSWVTKGREIENYLTEKTLTRWLQIEKVNIDSDKKLEDIISKTKIKKYDLAKSKHSIEISKHIEIDDLEILDLKIKMNQLVKSIKSWNN